jgi:hypothetical protein
LRGNTRDRAVEQRESAVEAGADQPVLGLNEHEDGHVLRRGQRPSAHLLDAAQKAAAARATVDDGGVGHAQTVLRVANVELEVPNAQAAQLAFEGGVAVAKASR